MRDDEPEYRLAAPDELAAALQWILSGENRRAAASQVADFTQTAADRKIDLTRLWVAVNSGDILWALLPVVSPGRTMLLLLPSASPADGRESVARALLERVLARHVANGIHLCQALLEPAERTAQRLLVASKFQKLAELIYLHRPIRAPESMELPPTMRLLTYCDQTRPIFARAIQASYAQSLDCPGLNGLREIDDVIAGHQASGEYDPGSWFALVEADAPVGVLLLSKTPRSDGMELVYLGIDARHRGRGFGDLLMRHALSHAFARRLPRLTLAVDSENAPALRLYYRHGMHRIGLRMAFMRDLRSPGP